MFGKKPTSPLKPNTPPAAPAKPSVAPLRAGSAPAAPAGWAISLLTTNYVISGYMPRIEVASLIGWLNIPAQAMLTLTQAQVTALDPKVITPTEVLPQISVPRTSVIVLMPQDELSAKAVLAQLPPRTERATIYAGPYWLRGAFRPIGDMPLHNLFPASAGDMLVVSDVEVKCVRVDAKFQSQRADGAIVNKTRVQLFHGG